MIVPRTLWLMPGESVKERSKTSDENVESNRLDIEYTDYSRVLLAHAAPASKLRSQSSFERRFRDRLMDDHVDDAHSCALTSADA